MTKTNFTKVEEMLSDGLRKMKVESLLDMADEAAQTQSAANSPSPEQTHLMTALQHELSVLQKQGHKPYEKLGVKKSFLKKLIENAQRLTSEEWEEVGKIKTQVDGYKNELAKSLPQTSDEDIVKAERRSHRTKRFNTNKNWLPLH